MSVSTLNTVRCKQASRIQLGNSDIDPVTKNPLSPVEHPGGVGVNCELFELGVDQFVVRSIGCVYVMLRY